MSAGDAFGRTIQIFLFDGKPTGLRKATIHGWTGLLFISGASAFNNLAVREEVDRAGVYILSGLDPDNAGTSRIYIGSGNSVTEQIRQIAPNLNFWETAVTVTTSNEDLSKWHAEYLEARLIELALKAGRVSLENCKPPKASRRRLPEADRANMEQFLANLAIILPVIGLDMLESYPRAVTPTTKPVEERKSGDVQFEIRRKNGLQAMAVEDDSEFIVLEGSGALSGTSRVMPSYVDLRNKLIADGVLIKHDEITMRFAKSWSFSSPSAAASIVLNRSSNGPVEWKIKDSTQTYRDWKQAQSINRERAE